MNNEYEPSCSHCKYADYYPISFFDFRFTDPKCRISKMSIAPTDYCEHFELIGRYSR